jgi:hypothetical protein
MAPLVISSCFLRLNAPMLKITVFAAGEEIMLVALKYKEGSAERNVRGGRWRPTGDS